jgi:tetratricopeptide (TPR) repeat protein
MRRCFVFLVFSILFSITVYGQDVAAIVKEAQRLEAALNEKAAFNKFKEVLQVQPNHLLALTKCSELASRISKREKSKVIREAYYSIAKSYATTALKVDATSSDANAAMAIAMGRAALDKSGKEKVAAVKDIKKYCDLALKYNPNNYVAWHIIGKWHYEVSNLNGLERTAAKIFFGGLPSASLKESIQAYEKAKTLDASFVLNYLELARAYKRNNEKQKAISMLTILASLPNKTEDDPNIKEEASKFLKELQ